MAYQIPTTEAIHARQVAAIEARIGQSVPLADKAFVRVLSAALAMGQTELYKYAAERVVQNLAITATGADLDVIGDEFGVPRRAAESAVLTGTIPAVDGTVIATTSAFIGDNNGERYFPDAAATATGGSATVTVSAETPGANGNLEVSDTLTISAQIAGAESTLTVTSVDNVGADEETDSSYRPRVLFRIRASFGGGDAADYKAWAQAVAGVKTAYPFAGRPAGEGTSYPGDRTVYVECEPTIQIDGIAPASLLDEVREALNYDPDTGESRPPLGLVDSTLFVESIARTSMYVTITNLTVDVADEADLKADIETAVDGFFRSVAMYVDGIDVPWERNDTITDLALSRVVQNVLVTYAAYAEEVAFALVDTIPLPSYTMEPGELVKLGSITYA